MKHKITAILVVGIALLVAATSAEAAIPATDTVGPIPAGATYIITPGFWTRDGVVIGITFPNGDSIPPPPNPKSDTIKLPQVPNDFHYEGDVYQDPQGNITIISAWYTWSSPVLVLSGPIIVGDGSVPKLSVMSDFDYTATPDDPNVVIDKDGLEVYDGPLSEVPFANLQLTTVGTREANGEADVPTVSEWGLIVMTLLLLTAGTIVFGRRRRPAVA